MQNSPSTQQSTLSKSLPQQDPQYTIQCLKCLRLPCQSLKTGEAFLTHVCYPICGNVYWTLNICPNCEYPQSTMFVERPRHSSLIQCKHCLFKFYLFRCHSCKTLFFKKQQSYSMGQLMTCQYDQCPKKQYKIIVCQCGGQVIKDKNDQIIQGYTTENCPMCKKDIIYTLCSQCNATIYHDERLTFGERIKCKECKHISQYVPCPLCGRTTKHKKFHYCMHYRCNFCQKGFEYSKCPYCSGENYHVTEKSLGPSRKCSNSKCLQEYFVINCHKCEVPVYFESFNTEQARQQDCPNCKTILKFYYCSCCGTFNPRDTKCIYPNCPSPKLIKSYYMEAKRAKEKLEKEKENEKNLNYEAKECKVCYDKESCMVNNTCGHVMMCEPCCRQYLNRNNRMGGMAECPICKKIGQYTKTIQYIYA